MAKRGPKPKAEREAKIVSDLMVDLEAKVKKMRVAELRKTLVSAVKFIDLITDDHIDTLKRTRDIMKDLHRKAYGMFWIGLAIGCAVTSVIALIAYAI